MTEKGKLLEALRTAGDPPEGAFIRAMIAEIEQKLRDHQKYMNERLNQERTGAADV